MTDETLELSASEMRTMADAVVERAVAHLASIPNMPSSGNLDAADLCRAIRETAPEAGMPLETLLDALFGEYIPRSLTTIGEGYLGYVPGGGLFPAALYSTITVSVIPLVAKLAGG